MAVLKNLKAEQEELERLRAEVNALKTKAHRSITYKIGEKGGLSVYGLGRFPVTLYKEQWERLLDHKEFILEFMSENASRMKIRD